MQKKGWKVKEARNGRRWAGWLGGSSVRLPVVCTIEDFKRVANKRASHISGPRTHPSLENSCAHPYNPSGKSLTEIEKD